MSVSYLNVTSVGWQVILCDPIWHVSSRSGAAGYFTLLLLSSCKGGSVAEWLACWTQAQKGLGSNRSRDAVG